jgi:two-component system phosphate regulon sensor histidine kinase PhoR
LQQNLLPDVKIEKSGNLDVLDKVHNLKFLKDIASAMPLQERVSKKH